MTTTRGPRPALDATEWHAQLVAAAERRNRERERLAEARREKAARRQAGMVARHAWRQAHLDVRAADADRPLPSPRADRSESRRPDLATPPAGSPNGPGSA